MSWLDSIGGEDEKTKRKRGEEEETNEEKGHKYVSFFISNAE
jgi:hypothetical protein